jgi:four helix bundle suffix protein
LTRVNAELRTRRKGGTRDGDRETARRGARRPIQECPAHRHGDAALLSYTMPLAPSGTSPAHVRFGRAWSTEVRENRMSPNYLLDRQLDALEQHFLKEGGFTERLYHARRQYRQAPPNNPPQRESYPSDPSHTSHRFYSDDPEARDDRGRRTER